MTANTDSTEAVIAGILSRATPINDNQVNSPETPQKAQESDNYGGNRNIHIVGNNNIIIDTSVISTAIALMLSAIFMWLSILNR